MCSISSALFEPQVWKRRHQVFLGVHSGVPVHDIALAGVQKNCGIVGPPEGIRQRRRIVRSVALIFLHGSQRIRKHERVIEWDNQVGFSHVLEAKLDRDGFGTT